MGNSKITSIGRITSIGCLWAEGLIFQGKRTRLVSILSYEGYGDEYHNNYYDIRYQIKSGTKYIDLFSIRHGVNKSIYRVSLLNRVTSKGNSIGPREEKTLSKLKKEKITENKTYAATTYIYQATNPVQFCTIPFLEDEVKNWILTEGQLTYSEKDFKAMAKSLIS
jgi:hypothetical protein